MTASLPPEVDRVAVLGDIGGQATVFHHVLRDLGADPATHALPARLAVVQVGDLVRAGAGPGLDNDACVALAGQAAAANPGRWIQLFGNHDLALLGGPTKPDWPGLPSANPATIDHLHRWWARREAVLAVGLRCREYGDVLITHAGLTRGRWRALGAPATATEAAHLINDDVGQPVHHVIRGGRLTGTDSGPDAAGADVIWAEVANELYQPWLTAADMPFTQIHGHATPWNWPTNDWWPDTPADVRHATTIDHATRRTTTTHLARGNQSDRVAICVDWTLGNQPTTTCWPLLTLTPSAWPCWL
jgi:hypothetical protein